MTNANRSIGLIVGCVVLIGAAHVVAQDWPQWRGSDRDGKVAEFAAPETWPGALIKKWKTTVGSGDATPALVGDKLYVFARQGEDEVTLCLNAEDGKELWRDTYTAQAVTGAASRHPGPRSSPTVAKGKIVTLTENSVVGVGLADGKLLWQLPFVPQRRAYNAATPIIDGQTVIYTGAGRGTNAVKIEKQGDGFVIEELWSNSELAPQYNTPVLIDGLLFGLSNRGKLFCINAKTGQTAWTDETSLDRKGFGAIVHAGSTLLALTSNSELVTFAPSDKQFTELARIKVADTSTYAHPVIAGNRIFVKDQDAVTMWTIK